MAVVRAGQVTTRAVLRRRLRAVYWPAVLYSMLAGGIGGLVGWLPGEAVEAAPRVYEYLSTSLYFGVLGAGIGLVLGLLPGLLNRASRQAVRGAVVGTLIGAIGGGLMGLPGQWVYMAMHYGLLARAVAWGVAGAGIGLCPGVVTADRGRAGRGLLAGLTGGFIAGLLFELVWALVPHSAADTGTSSRFVSDIVLGLCIGMAVALAEVVAQNAWLKVISGRREGAQFILSKEQTQIGRDDRDDILLWGDPQLALHHARITRSRRGYLLEPLTNEAATLVNGQAVSGPTLLTRGDDVTLGATHLLFGTHQGPATPSPAPASTAPGPDSDAGRRASAAGLRPVEPVRDDARAVNGGTAHSASQTEAPPGGRFQLVGLHGLEARYPLDEASVIRIGRGSQNEIILTDETVSASHAQLRWEEGRWVVYDLASTNGTFVSYTGNRADERGVTARSALRVDSTVRFGNVAFRLEQRAP